MSGAKWKVFWNTIAQIIGRIVGAGTTFAVSLVIARAFGAEGYGDFTKITTYVAPFYLLADFGMNAVYLQKPNASWGELFGVRIVASVLLMFLALAILVFLPQGVGQGYTGLVRLGILVFLPSILFQAIITTTNAKFQHTLRYDLATVAVIAGSLVTIAMVWALIRVGTIGAIGGVGTGALVTAATALLFVKKLGNTFELIFAKSSFRSYIIQSLPLGMTLVFNLIYFRADHFILTLSRSTAEVGIYALAYKVFEFPLAFPTFFMNTVYPLFLKATTNIQQSTNNSQQFQKIFQSSFWLLVVSSLLMVVVLWVAAPLLSVVRPEFGQSIPVLRVLSLGLPFFFLSSLTMWTLIARKRHAVLAAIYGASMIANIILNAWLVPIHGYMAAGWVTVASEALVLLMSVMVLWRRV